MPSNDRDDADVPRRARSIRRSKPASVAPTREEFVALCRRVEALEEQVETLQAEVQSRDADERRVAAILVAIREAAHVVTFTAASTAKEQLVEFTSAVCDTITKELVNECMDLSTPAHGIAKHARELLVEGILGNAPQPRSEPSGGHGRSLARINLEDFI